MASRPWIAIPKLSWGSVDRFYRSFVISRFFDKGWGTPDNMRRLFEMRSTFASRERREAFLAEEHPIRIRKEEKRNGYRRLEGEFKSPLYVYHPALFEPPVELAKFEMVIPDKWAGPHRPLCIHMAGTGDHFYWRRRVTLAKPLAREHGIGSIILVNPFYGERKPKDQFASSLKNVTDLFVMGGSLIFEGMTLLNWATKEGYGPLCLTGISMGGHMASLAASHYPRPVALVPCLSWSTASQCFTEGVLSKSVPFEKLAKIYHQPEFQRALAREVSHHYHSQTYGLGRYFAAHFDDEERDFRWSRHIPQDVLKSSVDLKHQEALDFMRGMMDEFTHLGNYPQPVDTSLIIAVEAKDDVYIPREGVTDLRELWPHCEVRYFESGHVAGCLLYNDLFRKAIVDALGKMESQYYKSETESSNSWEPSNPVPPLSLSSIQSS